MSKIGRHDQRSFEAKEECALSPKFPFLSILTYPDKPLEEPKLLLTDSCERETDSRSVT